MSRQKRGNLRTAKVELNESSALFQKKDQKNIPELHRLFLCVYISLFLFLSFMSILSVCLRFDLFDDA